MDRIDQLRIFIRVAHSGSFTLAADQLGLPRPTVSLALQQLEARLGARLLHRTTRRLSLTGMGAELLPRCRDMLALADELQSAGQRVSSQLGGTLRIASSQSFAQAWLARAVAAFVERHPAVAVDLQVSSQAVNLVEERIDLALRITNQLDPNLIARRLATCHSVLCAAPAYLARHGTPQTPAELARHNCLTYAYFGRSLWQFERDGEPSGVPVSGNISANESTVLLEACVAGAGISLQPLYAAAPLLRAGHLVQLLPQYRAEALGIHALYGSRRQMLPALRALLDFLAARLQGDPHWEEQLAP